jgi:endonuclease-3 related protein
VVAIFNFAMAATSTLPNSVYESLRMRKSASRDISSSSTNHFPGETAILKDYFIVLYDAHGPQHWWPGRSRFEVIVGAILTQSTSWTNVESAIRNLRAARLLTPRAIDGASLAKVARLVRPSGYFRQKAKKLKAFVHFLASDYSGSLSRMFRTPTALLRSQLLSIHGIGPETADSILLYAGKRPVFVIDAYARRILERHGLAGPKHSYEDLRSLFESNLPHDPQLFNEFHALIVQTGKHFCRKSKALCDSCPLKSFLPADAKQ